MKGYKRGSKKEVMVGTNHHIEKVKRGKINTWRYRIKLAIKN